MRYWPLARGPRRRLVAAGLAALLLAAGTPAAAAGAPAPSPTPVRVRVDGTPLDLTPPPLVTGNRTLVPLRPLFAALGAAVAWDGQTRTVTATRGDRYVRLQAGSRIACLDPACGRAALLDMPPELREGRTFVPLRAAVAALGAAVHWDAASRTAEVTTSAPPAPPPVRVAAPAPGATVIGPVELRAELQGIAPQQVRWFLLDPATGRGPLLAVVTDPAAPPPVWRPDPARAGARWLLAAAYGADGRPAYSELVPVTVQPDTAVALGGLQPEQQVTGPVELRLQHGFQAAAVRYERRDPRSGAVTVIGQADPAQPFLWVPHTRDNGRWLVEAVATDRAGQEYRTAAVPVQVAAAPAASLAGLKADQELTGPVLLRVRANFPVGSVQYYLTGSPGDQGSGGSRLVAGAGAQPLRWLPPPELNGAWLLSAVVYDQAGAPHYTPTVPVRIRTRPGLVLAGVGPEQVVSGPVELQVLANRELAGVDYILTDPESGQETVLARGVPPAVAYRWDPAGVPGGRRLLRAAGTTAAGPVIHSEPVPVRVFTGKTYDPAPAMPKDQFLPWAREQAVASSRQTGMSAALQVAQAILESAFGQLCPVDRYTGRPSYNLFGIKGSGPAGSVTHNTWEEYEGTAYRIEQQFRAYHSPEESWADHKHLLLDRPWYAPFRAVMWNPLQAAWALQRSGYATDSRYPLKLIDIMRRYDLYALDEWEP